MHVSDDAYDWVSRPEAAKRLGVSMGKLRGMIQRGEIQAEQVSRPQGTAYLVRVPHVQPSAEQVLPIESEDVSPSEDAQVPSTSPTRDDALVLAQLEALTQAHERLAEAHLMIASLREERGTYRERAQQMQARAEAAEARLAAHEADLAAERERRPWWRRWW